jgi:hypothetical protein
MKARSEMIEGPEAARRFDATVRGLLSVSRDEIMRREAELSEKGRGEPK